MNHSEPQEQPSPLFVSSSWLDKDYVSPQRFTLGTKANRVLPPPLGVESSEPASSVATTSPEVAEHSERSEASPSLVGGTPSTHTRPGNYHITPCGGWLRELCAHGNIRWKPLPCRKWSCEDCAPGKRWEFLERLEGALELSRGKGWTLKFVTLSWAWDVTKERVRLDLAHFVQSIRREYGFCEYAKVPEFTKRGRIHLHLAMVMPFIPQRKLSAIWKAHSGAPVVDIRAVYDIVRLRNELSKYLTKGPAGKVTYSRHFPEAVPLVTVKVGPCDACGGQEHTFMHISADEAEINFRCEGAARLLPGLAVRATGQVSLDCGCWIHESCPTTSKIVTSSE